MKHLSDNITAAIGIAGGVLALIYSIAKATRWMHKTLRQLDRFLLTWWGDPTADEGDEARYGLVTRLRAIGHQMKTIEGRLDRIETQLKPNGGSSLADAVTRIAQSQGVRGVGEKDS